MAQAAHQFAGHLTRHELAEFAVVFALVWIAWFNGSLHHELHGRRDARSRVIFLVAPCRHGPGAPRRRGCRALSNGGARDLPAPVAPGSRALPAAGPHLPRHGLGSLALGALRPAPLILGLVLVALLGIPWLFAVMRRLSTEAEPDPEINHL